MADKKKTPRKNVGADLKKHSSIRSRVRAEKKIERIQMKGATSFHKKVFRI